MEDAALRTHIRVDGAMTEEVKLLVPEAVEQRSSGLAVLGFFYRRANTRSAVGLTATLDAFQFKGDFSESALMVTRKGRLGDALIQHDKLKAELEEAQQPVSDFVHLAALQKLVSKLPDGAAALRGAETTCLTTGSVFTVEMAHKTPGAPPKPA